MPLALCVGDLHVCPKSEPNGTPHVGGPVTGPGADGVFFEGRAAALQGDDVFCVGTPDSISTGIEGVFIEGTPAADPAASTAHGGKIAPLCQGVFVY